ncbi:DUF2520 domain-containing protein [Pusillimonas sp. ANT_WB101]|nr:DUF2520 domain-containing protein [Pusillimonas sp. ANT_WB101]
MHNYLTRKAMTMPHTELASVFPKIGFIGAGRLGCALAWCLDQNGAHVHAVASRSVDSANALATGCSACAVMSPQQVADECDLIFITTSDAAIAPTAQSIRWRPGSSVVHCSGATEVQVLGKALAEGAEVGGFHPMHTFADPVTAARTLSGCVITIEAGEPLSQRLSRLAMALGCTVNHLPAGMRVRYHASCGFASQFVNVLLAEGVRAWQSWGSTEQAALDAFLPMLRGTVASIESSGLAKGMPGPVSRGDTHTVERHVQALGDFDPEMASFYRALCRRSVPLAQKAGRIDDVQAASINSVLDAARSLPE